MKENSIEEITFVENEIKNTRRLFEEVGCYVFFDEDLCKSIEHILSAYKRVLKENEKWQRAYQEEKDKQFDLIKENNKYTIHLTDKQYNAVIENAQNDINQKWIQKVKDKIEELEEEKKYYYSQYKIEELNDKIQVLQELLKEREE